MIKDIYKAGFDSLLQRRPETKDNINEFSLRASDRKFLKQMSNNNFRVVTKDVVKMLSTQSSVTVSHDLGYVPVFFAFAKLSPASPIITIGHNYSLPIRLSNNIDFTYYMLPRATDKILTFGQVGTSLFDAEITYIITDQKIQ